MTSVSDIWASGRGARIRDALTELHAYALVLDAELHRTEDRLAEFDLAGGRSYGPRNERSKLRRRRTELAAQLDLLDWTISTLRSATDPEGRYL
jgi:hypothetical protein